MDRNGIKQLAEILDVGISSAPPSAKWMNIQCPFAATRHQKGTDSTPSFGVQINKSGVSRFNCFSCGTHAPGLGELIFELKAEKHAVDFKALNQLAQAEFDGSDMPDFEDDEDAKTGLFVFPEDWLESFPLAVNNGQAMVYLAGREGGPVPPSVAGMLGLRWDAFERRVCFPIRGEDKRLYGLHGRNVDPGKEPRYHAYGYKKRRNPHVWLGSDTVDWSRPVAVAESVFDYARVKQVYRNTISPLHGDLSQDQLEGLTAAFEIITILDPDKTGDKGRQKIRKWAGKKRIVEHAYLPEDTDGGKMTVHAMAELLAPFVKLDPILE